MHFVKWIAALAFALAFCAGSLFAQGKQPPPRSPVDEIRERLELIEKTYIAQLGFQERRQAMKLMDEIMRDLDGPAGRTIATQPPIHSSAISAQDFAALLKAIDDTHGPNSEVAYVVAKSAVRNWFTVDQLAQLVGKFWPDARKLEIIDLVFPKVVDKQRSYILVEKFTFPGDKEKLKAIIDSYQSAPPRH